MVFWNSFGVLNQEFSVDSNTFVTYWTDFNEIFLSFLRCIQFVLKNNVSLTWKTV